MLLGKPGGAITPKVADVDIQKVLAEQKAALALMASYKQAVSGAKDLFDMAIGYDDWINLRRSIEDAERYAEGFAEPYFSQLLAHIKQARETLDRQDGNQS